MKFTLSALFFLLPVLASSSPLDDRSAQVTCVNHPGSNHPAGEVFCCSRYDFILRSYVGDGCNPCSGGTNSACCYGVVDVSPGLPTDVGDCYLCAPGAASCG